MTDPLSSLSTLSESGPLRQLQELTKNIDKQHPAPTDLHALRALLANHPDLWRTIGDLAQHAAHQLINRLKATPPLAESLKHGLAALKTDLAYDTATPLERLLIEQVVLCWLRLNLVELAYTETMAQSLTPAAIAHWDKRLSVAQHRFLQACQSLARIRKLTATTPALQINIATPGSQQVNLINPEPTDV